MFFSIVPDTNVVIARALTEHPESPNQEFFRRFIDEIKTVFRIEVCKPIDFLKSLRYEKE